MESKAPHSDLFLIKQYDMNPTKRILVIDDESQRNLLEKIVVEVKSQMVLEWEQVEVLDAEYIDEQARLVPEKVYVAIDKALKEHQYNLVMVDYDYGQRSIDGLDVIKHVREKYRKVDIYLYSAVQEDVIRKVVGKNPQETSTEDIVSGINDLMNYRIGKMVTRSSAETEVIKFLRSEVPFSPSAFICDMLREHSAQVFSSCCPKLEGKTFGQIADMIDEDNNGAANEWLTAILEQLVVYLSEVNE